MKYTDILSAILLSSILISCNGKSQENVKYGKEELVLKSTDSLEKYCPIQQMKEDMDSISIKLEKIKIEIKKRRKNEQF